jgi:RNA polymerase sigma-70 factor (ECF subfamily)
MSQVDSDDARLLRSGDPKALVVLFDRHEDRVFRQASRLLGAREDAKDVVVMAFFELWRHRNTARLVDGSALPWLLNTASNLSRNIDRGNRRYRRLLERVPVKDPSPMEAEDESGVMTALNKLPSGQRSVVVLTILEGYPDREVAQVLGIPIGTVKSRLSRAKATLREDLKALEPS